MKKITDKERKINFIKKFSKIKLKYICEKRNLHSSNVAKGLTTENNIDLIYYDLQEAIGKCYIQEGESNE